MTLTLNQKINLKAELLKYNVRGLDVVAATNGEFLYLWNLFRRDNILMFLNWGSK